MLVVRLVSRHICCLEGTLGEPPLWNSLISLEVRVSLARGARGTVVSSIDNLFSSQDAGPTTRCRCPRHDAREKGVGLPRVPRVDVLSADGDRAVLLEQLDRLVPDVARGVDVTVGDVAT